MTYVLTGAVMLAGTYEDENGAERNYKIVRGQSVDSLGLPHSVVKELIGRTRPLGGRRGNPIPYFTKTADTPPVNEDRNITVASLHEGIHKSRVEAGVVEAEEEFTKDVPQPPADPDAPLDKYARTPDEAAAAATDGPCCGEGEACSREDCTGTPKKEEPAAEEEPVVSPDEEEAEPACTKPDCKVVGDVAACEDDECPVNEAPVEADTDPAGDEAAPAEVAVETPAQEPAAENKPKKKAPPKKGGAKKKSGKKPGKSSK